MISSASRGGGMVAIWSRDISSPCNHSDDIIHQRQNAGPRLAFIPQGGVFHVDTRWRGGFLLTNGVPFKWFPYSCLVCTSLIILPQGPTNCLIPMQLHVLARKWIAYAKMFCNVLNKHTLGMLLTLIPVRTPKVFPLSKISFFCG